MANAIISEKTKEITQIKLKNNDQYYLKDDAVRTTVSNMQVSLNNNYSATTISETSLASGDSFETAIGKLHTGLNTTEQVVEAGLNDLDERLSNLEEHDYSKDYFTIVSLEDNNDIKFKCLNPSSENTSSQPQPLTIYVSIDNGTNWTEKTSSTSETIIATLNTGDKLLIKGNNAAYTIMDIENGDGSINLFKSTKTVNIEGNIMSLVYGDNFSSQSLLTSNYTFASLFGDAMLAEPNFTDEEINEIQTQYNELIETLGEIEAQKWYSKQIYSKSILKIISAENLILPNNLTEGCYVYLFYSNTFLKYTPKILPATTLTAECYICMFCGCTSLITSPELPATTLVEGCYEDMFMDCISLTTAPELHATILATNCYNGMFHGCTSLTTAPELPATTLAENCYRQMFRGCISLTTAPKLHATTLASSCYCSMFYECRSLTIASELPATTLVNNCYDNMFSYCTSLTTAPELPATILAQSCYIQMFYNCTSLTSAPELPATTLVTECYSNMFQNCTSLTTAPKLPATTLTSECYQQMFQDCTSLRYIKCLATDISASSCTYNWTSNVASTGTFIKALSADWSSKTGTDGIPSGWTVYTDEEYKEVKHHELATVATSGSYNDLTNKPTIPTKVSDLTNDSGFTTNTGTITGITMNGSSKGTSGVINLGTVITQETKANWNETNTSSAAYIQNKPTIPTVPTNVSAFTNDANYASQTYVNTAVSNLVNSAPQTLDTLNELAQALGNDANFSATVTNSIAETRALADKKLTDYSKEYLTFTALQNTAFTFSTNALQYSLDDGTTWTTLAKNTASPTVTAGNKIMWKQTGLISDEMTGIGTFSATGNFEASGNIMSLYYGDDFIGQTSLSGKIWAFNNLFNGNNKLTNAENLILPAIILSVKCYSSMFSYCTSLTIAPKLPATTLADSCYQQMFCGCTSLTTAPELPAPALAFACYNCMLKDCTSLITAPKILPATTLANSCYSAMFQGCTSLITTPELPATTLANSCYSAMFSGCTALTTAPELPVTTLANGCYTSMFMGCTSLATAPELHATTLATNCYYQMFKDCTTLTTAPELPATTLTESCYRAMFQNCNLLTYIKCLATDISATNCTTDWVNNVAATGKFITANTPPAWTADVNGIPSGWTVYTDDEYKDVKKYELGAIVDKKLTDYSKEYLTFTALESGTFTFSTNALQYSTDGGSTWNTLSADTATPTVTTGNKIMWKQTGLTPTSSNGIGTFYATGNFEASGNIMSLYYGDNFIGQTDLIEKTYAFRGLFYGNTKLISAENLILPATSLTNYCYSSMFSGCTALTTAPELPATTLAVSCYLNMFYGCTALTTAPELHVTILANQCYYGMFEDCTALTTAPELPATTLATNCYNSMFSGCTLLTTAPKLPATTLADYCYQNMFVGCTSLKTVPEILPAATLTTACYQYMFKDCTALITAPKILPATTLANNCYDAMFRNCTSLTTAPELPATTLVQQCYQNMFQGCTSLTTAPVLPATTLATYCYYWMFQGCTNLNYIKCLATDISASNCTYNWVKNVSATGKFITANTPPAWTEGANGIPSSWTVYTESEYEIIRKYEYNNLFDNSFNDYFLNGLWGNSKPGLTETYDKFIEKYNKYGDSLLLKATYCDSDSNTAATGYQGILSFGNDKFKSTADTPETGQTTDSTDYGFSGIVGYIDKYALLNIVITTTVIKNTSTSEVISTSITSTATCKNIVTMAVSRSNQYNIQVVSELPETTDSNTIYIVQ